VYFLVEPIFSPIRIVYLTNILLLYHISEAVFLYINLKTLFLFWCFFSFFLFYYNLSPFTVLVYQVPCGRLVFSFRGSGVLSPATHVHLLFFFFLSGQHNTKYNTNIHRGPIHGPAEVPSLEKILPLR
jgi:hypothetical protein